MSSLKTQNYRSKLKSTKVKNLNIFRASKFIKDKFTEDKAEAYNFLQ